MLEKCVLSPSPNTKKISKLAKKSGYGNCDRPRKRKEQCAKNQKCFH